MPNQEIRCNVECCRHNDKTRYCTLPDIVVGASNPDVHNKRDTECASFDCE